MTQKIIRLSKSCIGPEEKKAVMEVLDFEYLGMGSYVEKFEKELSAFLGRPAVCVVNGTAALHLAVQACGLKAGDEVLVPSLTYVASFQAISATGAKPVACDIHPDTCLVDLIDAQKRLTPSTKAIMPVYYAGESGNRDEIYAFAREHQLRVIEDAAHAFGSVHEGKRIGSFGDITCFSFDGIKNITSGEGGCIVTDDVDILQKVKDARLLGVEKDSEKRFLGQRSWEFNVTLQGWRYHMSNIMAAIGLVQLKKMPHMAAIRQTLASRYDELFKGHTKIKLLKRSSAAVPHIYVVRIKGLLDRKALQDKLLAAGIQTGVHYQPNHLLSLYHDSKALPCSQTESLFPELLTLPLHPDLSAADIDYVADQLSKSV
ncbi:DegT/DnrJ/EryC1/StrS family aminotransferase [bacterium]|nr:DegT/DnrJ/EryC1/StrS family aminotransferase [bacterium]